MLNNKPKTFYDYENPRKALEAFLNAHDTLEDRMRDAALRRFLMKHLSPIENKTVLDVGAGGGIWTRFWLEKRAKVTALDKHHPILEGNRLWNPEAEFVEADAVTVELGRKFDIIFVKDMIEHVPDDVGLLTNMVKYLKSDGYLFLTTQNSLSLNYYLEGGYHYLIGDMGWLGYDPTHVRFYNPITLGRKLKLARLQPVKYWGTYHLPYRFETEAIFGRIIESKFFHLVELLSLNSCFPFNRTGYNIGVLTKIRRS